MKSKFLWISIFSLLLTGFYSSADAQKVDFDTQIKPLLEKHCMECHNNDGDSYPIEVKDDAFAFIIEGEPEESEMYTYLVTDDEEELMPPADFERPLNDEQIELIKTWIAEGAEWPDDAQFVMWKPEVPADGGDASATAGATSEATAEATSEPQDEDTAEEDEIDPRIFKAVGSLHPAILHLPMGLLLAAGLFAFLSLRGNFVMSDCAYYCLWLGVLTGILACVSGWYTKENSGLVDFSEVLFSEKGGKLYWHRLSALVTTTFGLLVALFAMSARAKDPDEGATWKLGAMILAAGIGYVGFTGGKLSHSSNHYKDLNNLWNEMISGEEGEIPAAVESDEEAMTGADNDDSMEPETGDTENNTQTGDLSFFGDTQS